MPDSQANTEVRTQARHDKKIWNIKCTFNDIVCEELGLKHALETTGIIQSIIRAALHIHDVTHSKNSRFIECLKTDINHSTERNLTSYTTRTELNPVHKRLCGTRYPGQSWKPPTQRKLTMYYMVCFYRGATRRAKGVILAAKRPILPPLLQRSVLLSSALKENCIFL